MCGNQEEAVGATKACPQLWGRVDGAPDRQPEQKGCYFLYFRFDFFGENAKGGKISGLKPMRKLDLRIP